MPYPRRQRTGRRAELAVEALFTDWGWVVGRDHIDIGYDLFVEPDHRIYRGARFHVQVKGTSQLDVSRISAKVKKTRLHQYAQNILPVFVVRATHDLELY